MSYFTLADAGSLIYRLPFLFQPVSISDRFSCSPIPNNLFMIKSILYFENH